MDWSYDTVEIGELHGRVFASVYRRKTRRDGDEELHFECADGSGFIMGHMQDCCENVRLEDVAGDLNDLVGAPITMAEEESNTERSDHVDTSQTWTFYKLATIKGYVTLRWLGESNGYYSESVDICRVPAKGVG